MCDNFVAETKQDRAKCWTPVKACIKGNTINITPVLQNLTSKSDIVKYWRDHYKSKLKGRDRPSPEINAILEAMTANKDEPVVIEKDTVVGAINALKPNCAYYDTYTPKLLKYMSGKFAEIFAHHMTIFINM